MWDPTHLRLSDAREPGPEVLRVFSPPLDLEPRLARCGDDIPKRPLMLPRYGRGLAGRSVSGDRRSRKRLIGSRPPIDVPAAITAEGMGMRSRIPQATTCLAFFPPIQRTGQAKPASLTLRPRERCENPRRQRPTQLPAR